MPSQEIDASVQLMFAQRASDTGMLDGDIGQQRANIDLLAQLYPLADNVTVSPADAGGVPGVWLESEGVDPHRVVLYLHGGAYLIGSSLSHRELASRIARAAGARCLVLDYRLAPEHPFPAALDDALAAYRYLIEDVGIAPGALAIAGDSAGGGLSAATLGALKEAGLPAPAAGVLLSPWLDLSGSGDSFVARADQDPICRPDRLLDAAAQYLAGAAATNPRGSALFADLAGFPPLLILVGTIEILYDDSVRFARRAEEAGVKVDLKVGEGLPHVWPVLAQAPEAVTAIEDIGSFLQAQLA